MINKQIYPKTKRISLSNTIYVTEKIDGSNLGLFNLNDKLYIAQRGLVFSIDEIEEIKDKMYKGLYAWLKENAENYKEKLLIEQELRDVAMELNKGEKIDWDDVNQEKISLGYNFPVNSIQCSYEYLFKCQGKIYCLDKNFKDVAIERIGEERLAKYLKGE